jgi:hypothetical protein
MPAKHTNSTSSETVVGSPKAHLKRRRSSGLELGHLDIPNHVHALKQNRQSSVTERSFRPPGDAKDKTKSATSMMKTELSDQTVAPFLMRHIPEQYAPLGVANGSQRMPSEPSNTKFCYRHRPDRLCKRQANEPSMDQLQRVR